MPSPSTRHVRSSELCGTALKMSNTHVEFLQFTLMVTIAWKYEQVLHVTTLTLGTAGRRVRRASRALSAEEEGFKASSKELFSRVREVRSEKRCQHCVGAGFPESWDEGATFHCSRCKKKYNDEERYALERLAMERVELIDARDAPCETSRAEEKVGRGVRVSWLKSFAQ
eukprot:4410310-Pyramimonas_sp.AAC.1